jgi:hypothetical protein
MGHLELPMKQKDIVIHSFELAGSGKLPMVVLKAVDEDYRIWWTMQPIEIPLREEAKKKETDNAEGDTTKKRPRAANNTRHEKGDNGETATNGSTKKRTRAANGTRNERAGK